METLIVVRSGRFQLTWSGPRLVQASEPIDVQDIGPFEVALPEYEGRAWGLEEETTYALLLQSLDGSVVCLDHADPGLRNGLVSADHGRVVHGRVRIGAVAGRMSFVIYVGDEATSVSMSVLPRKVRVQDVRRMRQAVEAVASGLTLSMLRPTAELLSAGDDGSPPVWVQALRRSIDALDAAMRRIDRRPMRQVVPTTAVQRPASVHKVDAGVVRSVRQRGLAADRITASRPEWTDDVPAHHWLASAIRNVHARVVALLREEQVRRPSARRSAVIGDLRRMERTLQDVLELGVLRERGKRRPTVPPLVLRRRAEYAEAYGAVRAIGRGIDLGAGALDIATQSLSSLFETWAVTVVIDLLAEALDVPGPTVPVDVIGTDVRVRRGRAHAVSMQTRGVGVDVAYEPRFPAPPGLIVQKPDLVVTLHRRGEERRIVLDAKYRRDDSVAYRRRYGAAGPPEDALGTLHRYRDAIVEGAPIERAVALFPGCLDETYYTSRLWTSIESIGVGAVPIVPGNVEALRRLIARIVG